MPAAGLCCSRSRPLPGLLSTKRTKILSSLGQFRVIIADGGEEISTRPFQPVTGRVWHGTALGGAKGRTDVPEIVDWYMDCRTKFDDLITHTMPLGDINNAFDLMHAGESIRSVVLYD